MINVSQPSLSIAIPTFNRGSVLTQTLTFLRPQMHSGIEILVMDQTRQHDEKTSQQLHNWQVEGLIRWHKLERPSTTHAMNCALLEARSPTVLFLDDDVIPDPLLIQTHQEAYLQKKEAWCVVGQVLQPGEKEMSLNRPPRDQSLRHDLAFRFCSTQAGWIENVIACNLSVKRDETLRIGGFDENFGPPVAYRFETELAKRVIANGGKIWFEPKASIRHLRAPSGGTRSHGSHLTSASPIHGVGDYYYALRCGHGWERLLYMLRRPFREVRTKFHLHHPWFIPVKFIGELRAMAAAVRLYRRGARLVSMDHIDHLHNEQ